MPRGQAQQWRRAMRLADAKAARAMYAVCALRNGTARMHGCGALIDFVEIKHLYQNTGVV